MTQQHYHTSSTQIILSLPVWQQEDAAKQAWIQAARRHEWDIFATLTTCNRVHDPTKLTRAAELWIQKWLIHEAQKRPGIEIEVSFDKDGNTRVHLQGPLGNAIRNRRKNCTPVWLAAVESHRESGFHLHVLIRTPPELKTWDKALGAQCWAKPIIYNQRPKGRNNKVDDVDDDHGATNYLLKRFNSNCIACSSNFFKP